MAIVTVLLPVFNGGSKLSAAVRSILSQELADFELLIIDDASTDGTTETVRQYTGYDQRIKTVFHQRNLGLATTLNEGLEIARCPFVARMDHDDESLPNRLSVQVEFMQRCNDVIVAGSFVYHMGAEKRFDRLVSLPSSPEDVRSTLPKYNCIYHPSVIMRREQVIRLGGYRMEVGNAEDYDLWLRASKRYALSNIPEPLLRYRFSVNGQTLGKKWQQLYYVYLAQAAYASADDSVDDAAPRAKQMLEQTDRTYFLGEVAKGTVTELVALRLWRDALSVIWRFKADIGADLTARLLRKVVRGLLGSAA